MSIPTAIRPFWENFLSSTSGNVSGRFYEAFHFGDNECDANELAELVLSGTKCATAGLLWSYEAENKPLPKSGSLSVVTNWQSKPLCVIESTVVTIVPYDEVTELFAATEGEGDKTLQYWRNVHWSYFGRECNRLGKEPDLQMPVVCEEFSVIYKPVN